MPTAKDSIIQAMQEIGRPAFVKEIAFHPYVREKLKYSSVKVYLRQLIAERRVEQTMKYGAYMVTKVGYGDTIGSVSVFRVHNVRFRVVEPWLGESDSWELRLGDIHIGVQFGSQNKQITGYLAKDAGFNYDELLLCLELVRLVVSQKSRTDVGLGVFEFNNYEIADDHQSLRLDEHKSITYKDFEGMIERFYQKGETTRREIKSNRSIDAESLMALYRGGFSNYQLIQTVANQQVQIAQLIEQGKRMSGLYISQIEMFKELIKRLDREANGK